MQLPSVVEKSVPWKQCSCNYNGLKYVAACTGCCGTKCQNRVTWEHGIEDRFDGRDAFLPRDLNSSIMFTD